MDLKLSPVGLPHQDRVGRAKTRMKWGYSSTSSTAGEYHSGQS